MNDCLDLSSEGKLLFPMDTFSLLAAAAAATSKGGVTEKAKEATSSSAENLDMDDDQTADERGTHLEST